MDISFCNILFATFANALLVASAIPKAPLRALLLKAGATGKLQGMAGQQAEMTTIVCSTAAHMHFGGSDARRVAAKFHLATAICRPIFHRGLWRARQCITIALQYWSFTPRLHGSF